MISLGVYKRMVQRGFRQSLLYRAYRYSEEYSGYILGKPLY